MQIAGAQPITYTLVAAGRYAIGGLRTQFNGLRIVALQDGGRSIRFTFDGARNQTSDRLAIVKTQQAGATAPTALTSNLDPSICPADLATEWPFTAHASTVGAEGFVLSLTDKAGRKVSLECADLWIEVIEFSKTN